MTVGNLNDLGALAEKLEEEVDKQQKAINNLIHLVKSYQELLTEIIKESREIK